ncbi:hypothetical protein P9B03_09700 [Metasolibacillus meyeri]|uniref:Uncharacterized protein n=1 Tax=Metasolibacillus meyeri TaxID=1071052 RepID=A0AAW9NMW4_9BACL|nr:hypothetical protein [Metasolibacillus meyeri]MEC1178755.1 hypothetical protein [Metasolibacillus meyeri]
MRFTKFLVSILCGVALLLTSYYSVDAAEIENVVMGEVLVNEISSDVIIEPYVGPKLNRMEKFDFGGIRIVRMYDGAAANYARSQGYRGTDREVIHEFKKDFLGSNTSRFDFYYSSPTGARYLLLKENLSYGYKLEQ